ncbi:MAG: hypothetical protein JNK16_00960 [Phycisphaerales bacterium]|nr:hypothetical protein [Phycisphaerales bacterium]
MKRACVIAVLVSFAGTALAAVPGGLVNYQGRLSDGGGNANGTYNMTFRLFDSSAAGSEIMNEVKSGANAVNVSGGVFTTTLGTNGVISDGAGAGTYTNYTNVFKDFSQVWVQVDVNGVAQLPRQRITAAPFAINANRANNLENVSIDSGSTWTIGSSPATLTIDGANMQLNLGGSTADVVNTAGALNVATTLNVAGQANVVDDVTVGNRIFVRYGAAADGDGVIYFNEGGSNTGEYFFWDNSAGRFSLSDDLILGQTGILELSSAASGATDGVGEVKSVGGVSIRIDTDNDESGPNAGVFAITANSLVPLLRLQSTDEANLELDNGVTTDAFDFAEAFRPVAGQDAMEEGDVVALAVGGDNKEHVELSTQAGQAMLLGVVSTKPAFTCGMGISAVQESDPALASLQQQLLMDGDHAGVATVGEMLQTRMKQEWRPIAMLGRVPCKVDTKYGTIRAGDRLTSSPTPGHAMKQIGPGMSLGIAMEDAAQPGKILILVRPMWYGGSAGEFGDVLGNASPRANVINASHTPAQTSTDSPRVAELEAETRDLKARLADLERLVTSQMQGNKVLTAR